jgi:glycyl-tRNA synthetase beta chain
MPDFLLEIGCEEIPARMIEAASRELRDRVTSLLQRERLEPSGAISSFDTPRRLAVIASGLPVSQSDITEQVNGPSAQIAYKDGQPTPAAHAFAKKVGVDVGKLEKINTPKGEYLAATVTRKGRAVAEILAEMLPKEISTLYWPKNMYWRKRGEVFVRPVRWLVAMLDSQIVPIELFGISAGDTSRGHRTIGSASVPISEPSSYVEALRAAKVLGAADR